MAGVAGGSEQMKPVPVPDFDASDPLYRRTALRHQLHLPVLGVPVRFAASHPELLAAVDEAFGHWRELDPAAVTPGPGVDVRLVLQQGVEDSPPDVKFRAADPWRWMVHTRGSLGLVDLEHNVGTSWVSRGLLEQYTFYRRAFVGFMTLMMVTMHDRTPMHAALVADGDTGLLLAGPSGSGKSTLAYAASRAGLRYLSDDAVYVQREPWRVWREAPAALLLPDAARKFSELAKYEVSKLPGNRAKVVVPMDTAYELHPWVTRAEVCLVERSSGKPRLERAGPKEILEVLLLDHIEDRDRYGIKLDEVAERLARGGGWRLTLSSDPLEAIPLVKKALGEIESR